METAEFPIHVDVFDGIKKQACPRLTVERLKTTPERVSLRSRSDIFARTDSQIMRKSHLATMPAVSTTHHGDGFTQRTCPEQPPFKDSVLLQKPDDFYAPHPFQHAVSLLQTLTLMYKPWLRTTTKTLTCGSMLFRGDVLSLREQRHLKLGRRRFPRKCETFRQNSMSASSRPHSCCIAGDDRSLVDRLKKSQGRTRSDHFHHSGTDTVYSNHTPT